jgi:putative DNA primase/helicase
MARKDDPYEGLEGEDLIRALIDEAVGDFSDDPPVDKTGAPEFSAIDSKLSAFPQNDLGTSARLRKRFGHDLMHIAEIGWLGWTGTCWSAEDGDNIAHKKAHDTSRALRREAMALISAGPQEGEAQDVFVKRVKAFRRFVKDCGNSGRINAMLEVAAPYLARRVDELDQAPFIFTAQNASLELLDPKQTAFGPLSPDPSPERGEGKESELLPTEDGGIRRRAPSRKDLLTRCAAVAYDTAATCPGFLAFLADTVPDRDIRGFLQRFFGYCLCGSVREQVVVMFYGQGSNGKSTLMDTITHVLGDCARGVPIASIMSTGIKGAGQASPDLARLRSARYVTTSEPDTGERFSEGTIKMLSGDERLTVRHLNKDYFEFYPQFKVVVSFNNKPNVRGIDEGFWRRILLVPFEQRFVDPHQMAEFPRAKLKIRGLGETLKAEGPGILNWMLDGYRLWRESGLDIPDSVRAATDTYRTESNPIKAFADDCLARAPGGRVNATEAYRAYEAWCKDNSVDAATVTMFGRRLADMGFPKLKSGVYFYTGVELTPAALKRLEWADSRARQEAF